MKLSRALFGIAFAFASSSGSIDFSVSAKLRIFVFCLVDSRLLKVLAMAVAGAGAGARGAANILLLIKCTQANLYPFIFKGTKRFSLLRGPKTGGVTL